VVWGCFESLRLILKLAPGGRLPARTLMMSASHSLQLVAPINYMKRVDYQHTHTCESCFHAVTTLRSAFSGGDNGDIMSLDVGLQIA